MSNPRDLEVRMLKRLALYRDALMKIERVASRFRKDAAKVPEHIRRNRGKGWAYEDGCSLVAQIIEGLASAALDEGEKS